MPPADALRAGMWCPTYSQLAASLPCAKKGRWHLLYQNTFYSLESYVWTTVEDTAPSATNSGITCSGRNGRPAYPNCTTSSTTAAYTSSTDKSRITVDTYVACNAGQWVVMREELSVSLSAAAQLHSCGSLAAQPTGPQWASPASPWRRPPGQARRAWLTTKAQAAMRHSRACLTRASWLCPCWPCRWRASLLQPSSRILKGWLAPLLLTQIHGGCQPACLRPSTSARYSSAKQALLAASKQAAGPQHLWC